MLGRMLRNIGDAKRLALGHILGADELNLSRGKHAPSDAGPAAVVEHAAFRSHHVPNHVPSDCEITAATALSDTEMDKEEGRGRGSGGKGRM
jgi:hypothetical protein